MTNKEKYKRTFSALHASGELREAHNMKTAKNIRFKKAAIICAAVIFIFALASAAYAADVGGIQQELRLWINGDMAYTIMEITDGSYTISYEDADGNEHSIQGGGITVGTLGDVRPATEEEIMQQLDMPTVKALENGTVMVYYRDQELDITERFDEYGICRVMLKDGEEALYLTVDIDGGFTVSRDGFN